MKTITALKEQSKNKKRVNVYLDGQFYIGLDLLTVMKLRLKEGLIVAGRKRMVQNTTLT